MSQHDNDHNERTEARRHFLKMAAGTAAVAAVAGSAVFAPQARAAQQLKPLSQKDSTLAKSLDYTDDANATKNPKRKPGDDCSNCMFYQGKAGSARGPCQIFPGYSVDAKGWCASHTRKPA